MSLGNRIAQKRKLLAFSGDKLVLQVGNRIAETVVELAEVTRIETE